MDGVSNSTYTPCETSKFCRDYNRMEAQGKKMELLSHLMLSLIHKEPLDPSYKDHKQVPAKGNPKKGMGNRICHIEFDWLLLYRIEGETVHFLRTGPHNKILPNG